MYNSQNLYFVLDFGFCSRRIVKDLKVMIFFDNVVTEETNVKFYNENFVDTSTYLKLVSTVDLINYFKYIADYNITV